MSSFVVSGTTATFLVDQDGFNERRDTALRTWDLQLFLAAEADYTTLASLWSGPIHIGLCPGSAGATYYVHVGGGAGPGALTLDNVVGSPFTAVLIRLARPSAYPSGGRKCMATFQEAP